MELKFKHFVFLNALDVLTTWYALTFMGLGEANPVASSLFEKTGLVLGLVGLKLIGLMVMYILIIKMPLNVKFRGIDGKKAATNIICFMFVLVVANNSYQMIRVIFS